jgi:hypothetical protein
MVESLLTKNSDKLKKEIGKSVKMSVFNLEFNVEQVEFFLKNNNISEEIVVTLKSERIDGKSLVTLNENDIGYLRDKYDLKLGNIKQLLLLINKVKLENYSTLSLLNLLDPSPTTNHRQNAQKNPMISKFFNSSVYFQQPSSASLQNSGASDTNLLELNISPPTSETGFMTTKPDFFKTIVSLGE